MKKYFREIGAKDHLIDSESRLSQTHLDEVNGLGVLVRTILLFLPVLMVLSGIIISDWPFGWLRVTMFLGGLFIMYLITRHYENLTTGHLVPLHAAFLTRIVFFVMSMLFLYMVTEIPLKLLMLIGLLLLAYEAVIKSFVFIKIRTTRRNVKDSTPSKVLALPSDIRGAIWLQVKLLSGNLVQFVKIILFLLTITFVSCYLFVRRYLPAPDEPSRVCANDTERGGVSLKVAHLSDLHCMDKGVNIGLEGASRNIELQEFFTKNKSQLNGADLIAITGDITDTGFLEEWSFADDVLSSVFQSNAGAPVIAMAPGNHDINIHLSFDNSVKDVKSAGEKLAWFGLGVFANRNVRLVRYLAFWDKWSGGRANILLSKDRLAGGRKFMQDKKSILNEFADKPKSKVDDAVKVEKIFNSTFPSVVDLKKHRIRVYCLNSNAKTWNILFNSIGWFDMGQLYRLTLLLREHKDNWGAIFLMHHHLKPGTSKLVCKKSSFRKRNEELAMITLNAFLFKLIIRTQLKKSGLILHGHTHFERAYKIGRHNVLCAPSTGYGEQSSDEKSCLARIQNISVDELGNIHLGKADSLTL